LNHFDPELAMPIIIRNPHLERQIDRHRQKRGHKTMAKTAVELLTERLTQLDSRQREKPAAVQPVAP
jgi:hypothetical protein